jgi:hypothetical protein
MNNETDKLIKEQLDALPADVKEAVARVPWKERVRDIAKRENLNVAQADSLETETMLILYGFLPPDTYVGNVTTEVGLGEEQAERIYKLVTDEIIRDIEKQFEMIEALMPKAPEKTASPEKIETAANTPAPALVETKEVEIAPEMLPETVPGEAAHDVPHMEAAPASAPAPEAKPAMPSGMIGEKLSQMTSALPQKEDKASYPKGVDPYREPIE